MGIVSRDDQRMPLDQLNDLLRDREISQAEMARVLGRSQGTISRYLSGEREMSAVQYRALEHLAGGGQPSEAQDLFPEL